MSNLRLEYLNNIIPKLKREFNYKNIHQIPKLKKIVISTCLGLDAQNKLILEQAIEDIRTISGQHPILTKAKKSISSFKLRKGVPLGLLITLRKEKMYFFLEKIIKLVLPRIRDFRGLNKDNFDLCGNYNFGIDDQLVFPEINYDNVSLKRGFNINIVIDAKNNEESFFLLKELGFPFNKIIK
jgi:large subunit ribosomal protein L5